MLPKGVLCLEISERRYPKTKIAYQSLRKQRLVGATLAFVYFHHSACLVYVSNLAAKTTDSWTPLSMNTHLSFWTSDGHRVANYIPLILIFGIRHLEKNLKLDSNAV